MRPNGGDFQYTMNYDQLKATHPEKSRLMSVITSNKAFTQGHRERLQFVEKLKAHFGDQLDLFGRGIRDFDDKWEVLAPYRYHICLENCAQPYYWSEKLADSLLAEAYPFYYGCTNLEQFFPEGGYKWIDIQDPERAIKIIEEAIAQDVATQEATALAEAKRLVLDEHNFFAMVAHHIDQHYTEAAHEEITIKDDLKFMDVRKVGMIWKRIKSK